MHTMAIIVGKKKTAIKATDNKKQDDAFFVKMEVSSFELQILKYIL